jgi:hypothetical protein
MLDVPVPVRALLALRGDGGDVWGIEGERRARAGALRLVSELLDQKGRAVRPPKCRTARNESIHSPVSRVSGSVLPLICFPSGEVLPSFNALAGIDFESLLLDTNGRFGRPT